MLLHASNKTVFFFFSIYLGFQLHGELSRAALPDLVQVKQIVYVLNANADGVLLNQISDEHSCLVDWILVDSATGGR